MRLKSDQCWPNVCGALGTLDGGEQWAVFVQFVFGPAAPPAQNTSHPVNNNWKQDDFMQ